ncbi:hypothetical protein RHSIM_RhsimUnG0038600 [Rhododendron simsii]|uniref:Uncharacterized protein n=1 Tax=Rhododendron simsii TaxID=118357 RepID=A0A834FZ79_RHOSS|nr:hypothetical protein RHSIM_RhsimUnG0038600 [Rhododendron simsii]
MQTDRGQHQASPTRKIPPPIRSGPGHGTQQIRMVYYYKTPPGRAVGPVTKKLRESISEMLNGFPMVTGRLLKNDEGQWMIKCNDARVRLVEVRAKGSVEGRLRRVDTEKSLSFSLNLKKAV